MMEMRKRDGRFWPWITVVVIAGLAMVAYGASRYTGAGLTVLLLLVVMGTLAERYAVGLFDSHVSVGVVAVMVAAILGGFWGVALVAPTIVLAGQVGTDATWYKRIYNVATYALAGGAFAGIFQAYGEPATPEAWPVVLAPALLGSLIHYVVNTGLVATAIALSSGQPVVATWRRQYEWLLPQFLVVGMVAMAAATAYHVMGLWGLVIFAAPMAAIRHAYFHGAKAINRHEPELHRAA